MANITQPNKLSSVADSLEEATILLYGDIGEGFKGGEEPQNTDKEFLKCFRALDGTVKRINIRLNSVGGSMYHGNAMITAIRNAKSEVHGYNDGICASMAADLWLACPHRHMGTNAVLMIHAPWSVTMGNAKQHRKQADILDKYAEGAIEVMARSTGMDAKEIEKKYYDGDDHFLSFNDMVTAGFINSCGCSSCGCNDENKDESMGDTAPAPYQSAVQLPSGIAKMSYADLRKTLQYQTAEVVVLGDLPDVVTTTDGDTDTLHNPDLLTTTTTEEEMTTESIKAAIAAGTLNVEDLKALLATDNTPAEKPVEQPEPDEFKKTLQAQADQIQMLIAKVDGYAKSAGDSQTHGTLPTADAVVTENDPVLKEFTAGMERMKENGFGRFVQG
jgi:ATP-dependent protease ClpP protease subunit